MPQPKGYTHNTCDSWCETYRMGLHRRAEEHHTGRQPEGAPRMAAAARSLAVAPHTQAAARLQTHGRGTAATGSTMHRVSAAGNCTHLLHMHARGAQSE